jgi:hypothetical protein
MIDKTEILDRHYKSIIKRDKKEFTLEEQEDIRAKKAIIRERRKTYYENVVKPRRLKKQEIENRIAYNHYKFERDQKEKAAWDLAMYRNAMIAKYNIKIWDMTDDEKRLLKYID